MNTYLIKSDTNYGEIVHVVNANNESDVRMIAMNRDDIWDGYEIEKISRESFGVVAIAGGK